MKTFLLLLALGASLASASTSCDSDWITFNRASGSWCVRVFYGVFTKDLASSLCANHGAVLSGVQNADERMKIADAARDIIVANRRRTESINVAGLWLGAKKKSTCQLANSCAASDRFEWTDGVTTGTDGFKFAVVQSNPKNQCIQQIVFDNSTTNPGWPGYQHGDLEETDCTSVITPPYKLYACGKNPK
uniref:C-type lectin domain-containing protein n=1 Tax=Caenorhabditis japonica TaxID=281687 RepID=A0A8R1HKZ7_CAEJA